MTRGEPLDHDEADEPAVELLDPDDVVVREVEAEVTVEPLETVGLPAADQADEPAVALLDPDDVVVREVEAEVTVEPLEPVDLEPVDLEPADRSDTSDEDDTDASPGSGTQLDVLDVEPTGDPRVDDALDRLRDLAGLPVAEHADVYEDVHRRLQDALTDLGPEG